MNYTQEAILNQLQPSTLDNLLEGCQILDFEWKYIYLNNSADKHNQRSKHELLGKRYMDMWPGIENTDVFKKIKECMESRVSHVMENEFTFPDGKIGWFELSIQPVPQGVFILSIDITEKKQIEKENLFKDERFKHVFETANVGKSITKINGEIEVNKAFCQILGYNDGELNNKHWKELTPVEDIDSIDKILESLISGEKDSARFPKRYIKKDSTIIWCDINVAIFRDHKGVPLYFITTLTDITHQKKTEASLRRSENLLKLYLEHSPAAIAMFDKNMCYIMASNRYLIDYGLKGITITGKSHYDIFPEIPDHWKEIHKRCLAGAIESAEQDPFIRGNGRTDWIHWQIHPWYGNEGEVGGIILFSEVVTHRVLAEKALRKSEELFNKAFHGSPSPMAIILHSSKSFIAVNDSFLELFELPREEVIGKQIFELNIVDFEEVSKVRKLLNEQITLKNHEVRSQIKSGKEIYFLLSVDNSEIAGEACTIAILQDITHRKQAELRLKEKSDELIAKNEEYVQLNEELSLINEELLEAKEQAEESDRLKTAFLHNISHEIRTPMNSIIGFSSLLRNNELIPEKRDRFLDILEKSSRQLLLIINDIISIASLEAGQVKIYNNEVNINAIILDLYEQFLPVADKKCLNLIYTIGLPEDKSLVLVDETKLIQILTNLLNNAFKFTETGYINFGYTLINNDLEFFVEDSGIGIPVNLHQTIFNRFHQIEEAKKPKHGGSGLGLSISKGYVELMGGKIWLMSEPGKGSVFYFTIPYNIASSDL